ncbi:MAG: single-stranded-DNA-specific exonuclease RecJ [Acidithiobacillus sp.]|uniref:single-stranded-DNA-specific exonuclease RecJ n=1 Tax=Acidithiobacillus ferrooxidans TaxID=920 RepID=UPI000A937139|nr:single-stranded-DNA-specific exonuclease RecJ [Acidithiobacillus ferrooxidans]
MEKTLPANMITRAFDTAIAETLEASGQPSVMARIYAARGIKDASELDLPLKNLADYSTMADIGKASARLAAAIVRRETVALVGDFDCDGCTGTTLVTEFIRRLGGNVFFLLPDRVRMGYGLSPQLADMAADGGATLLITVDNGISAFAGVSAANALGMDVIVTDHHLPAESEPDAYAIVNPNRKSCNFPYKSTCGVGVAFYLAAATRRRLIEQGYAPATSLRMSRFLDIVALGTVADMVPLEYNNRILVQAGIEYIRAGHARPGLRALLHVAGINPVKLTAKDFGFGCGPRINAAGRLDDMSAGVQMLLAESEAEALPLAESLDRLNRERRDIEKTMLEASTDAVDRMMGRVGMDTDSRVICLLDEEGHEGVVGLVAGRLREKYHHPAIVFAPGDGGVLKGSARSVDGLHIRDLLAEVDMVAPGVIRAFGGHAMAAGVSVEREHFPAFRAALSEVAQRRVKAEHLTDTVITDGEIPTREIGIDLARQIERAGPWGNGFPEPVFHGTFEVAEASRIGADKNTLRLKLRVDNRMITAIRFRHGDGEDPIAGSMETLVYQLTVNRYNGTESVQMQVVTFGCS